MTPIEASGLTYDKFSTISGIMSGFSLAVLFQILTITIECHEKYKTILKNVTFISCAFSATLYLWVFIVTSFISFGIITISSGNNIGLPSYLPSLIDMVAFTFAGGTFFFCATIGLSGWFSNRILGVITSTMSISFVASFIVLFGYVINEFSHYMDNVAYPFTK